MFDRTERAAPPAAAERIDREAPETSPNLSDLVGRARRLAADWRTRALDETDGQTPWLLHVPDVGPACEVILADQLLHDLRPDEVAGLMEWIRGSQDPGGAWLDAAGREDLSLTTLGWWACRVAGDDPASEAMVRARRTVHALGGAQRSDFSVRLWLAMADQIPWGWLPAIPAEMFLLPPSVPLSPANYSPWARGMLTPYLLIGRAPARLQLPDATSLVLERVAGTPVTPRLTRAGLAGDLLQAFDRTVKLSRKLPRGPLPRLAARRAERMIERSQQAHGGWFSVRPTLLSLIALRVAGATSDDPRLRRGLDHLRAARGRARILHGRDAGKVVLAQGLSLNPLRATARLMSAAPRDTDVPWLLRQEIAEPGPWQHRADAPAGGWPLCPGARQHLDLDATCSVLEVLSNVDPSSSQLSPAWATTRRATDVILAMQEPDGHFSRFERGESDVYMQRFPWTDADLLALGHGLDEDHLRLTARALTQLAAIGFRGDDDRIARGLRWVEARVAQSASSGDIVAMPMATLSALARCAGAHCPPSGEHPWRAQVEGTLRRRQREAGDYGGVVDTALALQGFVGLGETCVQASRAARSLAGALSPGGGDAPGLAESVSTGFGLCHFGSDPSAGVREAAIALQSFAAAGGSLEPK
jgi:squalene-hopene/tetraprenyl-beta-curcumene cyclase